jgi:hypothetical protein
MWRLGGDILKWRSQIVLFREGYWKRTLDKYSANNNVLMSFKICTPQLNIVGKDKVVSVLLFLTEHHATKAYWGSGCIAPRILTSAIDWGEWSASRTGRSTHRKRAPGTHWIGDWLGPTAGLDSVVKRKIPSPRRESNLRTPIVQTLA